MSKKKVMDDLDALLADLQSTTTHIQNIQQQQLHDQQQLDSRESTPPPVPPHPSENSSMYDTEPLYETQMIKPPRQNISSMPPKPNKPVSMASMSHNAPAPQRSSLSNNLSELDTLLQDLDSAQFMAEIDRRNSGTANGFQHSGGGGEEVITPSQHVPPRNQKVDNLLDELNRQEDITNHYEQVNIHNPPHTAHHMSPGHMTGPRQPAASSATRELDDLMASLSEFKMGTPAHVGEPPYAQSSKVTRQQNAVQQPTQDVNSRTPPHPNSTMQASPGGGHQGNNLEAMLGNLSTDMSKQGVLTVPKGHCAACSKPIVGQVITALGRIWHPEHFVCSHCKAELGTNNFFERDGNPFCERDYHLLFSPRCASCNGPILDKCVTALDKSWHPEHFICAHCKRPFGEDGFHEKDGLAYCRDDYFDMFAPKCGGCSRPIMDNYISALNKQWHPECFVCYECHMPFGASSFYDHDGFPFCETHYHAKKGSLCAGCQKPITGRCITAMYKKFHPEHFVCAFCLKQLNKGTFKEQKDKPYCHPCFVKLFG